MAQIIAISSISLVLRARSCARLEGRPQARSCPRPSFETAARRARPPQDEVRGLDHSVRLVSWNCPTRGAWLATPSPRKREGEFSLLRLLEIAQVGRWLILLGRHQVTVAADEIA